MGTVADTSFQNFNFHMNHRFHHREHTWNFKRDSFKTDLDRYWGSQDGFCEVICLKVDWKDSEGRAYVSLVHSGSVWTSRISEK